MSPRDIVARLVNADYTDGKRWQASHHVNGQERPRPTVKEFHCGTTDGGAWLRYKFTEDGADHEIRGTYTLNDKNEQIQLDSKEVEADDVDLGTKFVIPKGLRGFVRYEFKLNNEAHVYRFDTTLFGP